MNEELGCGLWVAGSPTVRQRPMCKPATRNPPSFRY